MCLRYYFIIDPQLYFFLPNTSKCPKRTERLPCASHFTIWRSICRRRSDAYRSNRSNRLVIWSSLSLRLLSCTWIGTWNHLEMGCFLTHYRFVLVNFRVCLGAWFSAEVSTIWWIVVRCRTNAPRLVFFLGYSDSIASCVRTFFLPSSSHGHLRRSPLHNHGSHFYDSSLSNKLVLDCQDLFEPTLVRTISGANADEA